MLSPNSSSNSPRPKPVHSTTPSANTLAHRSSINGTITALWIILLGVSLVLVFSFSFTYLPFRAKGNVTYQDRANATSKGLTFINPAGNAIIKVDNTTTLVAAPPGTVVNRDSVHFPFPSPPLIPLTLPSTCMIDPHNLTRRLPPRHPHPPRRPTHPLRLLRLALLLDPRPPIHLARFRRNRHSRSHQRHDAQSDRVAYSRGV